MSGDDPIEALRQRLKATEREVPTSRLGRLWKTGRSAASMGVAVLSGRTRESALDLEDVARWVGQLGELKGVAMKAGQILGYIDVTLPPELRGMMALLQTTAPASPFGQVEATVRAALGGRAEALLAGLERAPVAVASIAQVHRGRLPDGTVVAVKVRHPGIDEALRNDFRTAGTGSAFAKLLVPGAGEAVKGFVDEAREAILDECDFLLEAERQATFARLFAGDGTLVVPPVERDWCAKAVLTTHWMPGRSLDAFLQGDPAQAVRDRLGTALFSFYVGTLYRHGLFHADPHPGNYGFREDGRVVVYDFGCVRTFAPGMVAALARLVAAVRADDSRVVGEAMAGLGARPPTDAEGQRHLRELLRGFFAPLLHPGARRIDPGAGLEAGRVLRDKRALMRLRLPGRLLFLFRLRFGLYAVLARLGAVADWAELESRWAEEALTGPRGPLPGERGP